MFADPKCQLLVLVLPIVAGFISVFVIMLQASTRIENHLRKASASPAMNSSDTLGVLSISDAYDPDRSVLWENQVFALQRIGSHVTIPELLVLWERYLRLYPELYEQTSFSDWLAFLQNCNLVEPNGNVVRLTANGRDFLNVLIRNADLFQAKRVVHH
jgi:hypothetical protein